MPMNLLHSSVPHTAASAGELAGAMQPPETSQDFVWSVELLKTSEPYSTTLDDGNAGSEWEGF